MTPGNQPTYRVKGAFGCWVIYICIHTYTQTHTHIYGLPLWLSWWRSACNAGDLGSIPGLGRSPGEGKGYPLQYSGLENSMDYTVHGVEKSHSWATFTSLHIYIYVCVCVCVCVYTHTYIYIYIYTLMYICVKTYKCFTLQNFKTLRKVTTKVINGQVFFVISVIMDSWIVIFTLDYNAVPLYFVAWIVLGMAFVSSFISFHLFL